MSRRAGPTLAIWGVISGSMMMVASPSAVAQSQPPTTADRVFEDAQKAYGPPPPEPECAEQEGDEIVVCAREQDDSQFRVKSSTELDPKSKAALRDGVPRAPDVGGPGIFTGPATISSLCIPGLQSCPPPPAFIIDFTTLPDTPEGSDADKVAKGEIPAR